MDGLSAATGGWCLLFLGGGVISHMNDTKVRSFLKFVFFYTRYSLPTIFPGLAVLRNGTEVPEISN